MGKTKIEWAEEVWNPTRGCSRVSAGCTRCYAEEIAARFSGEGQPYEGLAERVGGEARWTGEVRLIPEKLEEPFSWVKSRRVFVDSMSDLFHHSVDWRYIARVFSTMIRSPRHRYLVLTKRPERMQEGMMYDIQRAIHAGCLLSSPFYCGDAWPPPNVWLGVSCEDQATADDRIPILLQTPAAIRFVSLEPLLGRIDLTKARILGEAPLDWVIVGGESGPRFRSCDPIWIEDISNQCYGVPCFVKQDSGRWPGRQGRINDTVWSRKEFPKEMSGPSK